MGGTNEHAAPLAALGIDAEACSGIVAYLDHVARWNTRTNLTGARDPASRVRVLVADAWRALPQLHGSSLIDIGSGNGSPGLLFAFLRPALAVTLVEPRARRWAFLREAARLGGRPDVQVLRARSEELEITAEVVTARAVGIPLVELGRHVRPEGRIWVFGGPRPPCPPTLEWLESRPLETGDLHVFCRPAASDVSRET